MNALVLTRTRLASRLSPLETVQGSGVPVKRNHCSSRDSLVSWLRFESLLLVRGRFCICVNQRPPLLSLTHLEAFNKRRSALKDVPGRDLPGFRSLFVTIGNWCADSGVASVFYFISQRLMLVTERNLFNHEWDGAEKADQLTMASPRDDTVQETD